MENENKVTRSQATKYALWIGTSRTEAPVRNPYLSEVDSGMYIPRGAKVRAHDRNRSKVRVSSRDLADRQERCRMLSFDLPWPKSFSQR